jgi:hypothetical protein
VTFLDAQQGTFEKIKIQRLSRYQAFQFSDAPLLPLISLILNLGSGPGTRNRDATESFISPSVHLRTTNLQFTH